MRKFVLTVVALASVLATGAAPTPAAAAPVSQAVLAAIQAMPESAVETVQYGRYERVRRFRARQAARRRAYIRRQSGRGYYR